MLSEAARLQLIREEVDRFYRRFVVDADLLELRNLVLVSDAILRMATARRESRGLHWNRDHPSSREEFHRDSILSRLGGVSWGEPIPDPGKVEAGP